MATKINYIWPFLHKGTEKELETSMAQLGHKSEMKLTFTNPSQNRPVFVQLVFDWIFGINTSYSLQGM